VTIAPPFPPPVCAEPVEDDDAELPLLVVLDELPQAATSIAAATTSVAGKTERVT
jgi:hypothetical protein